MTPQQKYQQDLLRPGFQADPAQGMAISRLERLYQDLLRSPTPTRSRGLFGWLQKPKPPEPVLGIYMWGGVGRGKTWLMDTFFDSLPSERKLRCHFHRFMRRIHDELQALNGQPDPLKLVAHKLASETDIICFDEFFVSDITDAMLLGTLFQELFGRGVVLVATSNIPPQDLYRNGLQRARFLPAIALIERHCEVLNVDGGIDYRLRTLEQAEIYHCPLDLQAKNNLERYFLQLTGGHHAGKGEFEVNHRQLTSLGVWEGVLYMEFEQLCCTARSQNDYIELARLFHTVLVANVQPMGRNTDDAARRFIAMVDEFYERHVKLIMSAAVPMAELYSNGLLNFEFQRCLSRLQEMQSHEYLARVHLP
ncbi:cell division protein ZapE [Aeromonas cavernicola]|uniref:Cell division protein ZapE n=1 Tax=Aeromonas cavernicola TaxID=1006623 RepID=A0A2H9U759_9GAMM|nr:cell division protein ZapE [Aeromonas cavernicola]PJG59828.1 cell division protein ZapE [Aeromonas cavernicola]